MVKQALEKQTEGLPVTGDLQWETVLSPEKGSFPKVPNHPKAIFPIARKVLSHQKMENGLNFPLAPLREAVMECMEQAGEPVREVELTPEALHPCDEVFLTNSLLEVFPVGRVDQDDYPVRERTARVLELFQAYRDRLHRD